MLDLSQPFVNGFHQFIQNSHVANLIQQLVAFDSL